MSKWKYLGSPEQVVMINLDRRKFKTNKGIIECPDGLDGLMAQNKQFEKIETKKANKAKKELKDGD